MDVNEGEPLRSLSLRPRCTTSQLDVTSPESIARFAQAYGDRPLDLLLNVAGVEIPSRHISPISTPPPPKIPQPGTFHPFV